MNPLMPLAHHDDPSKTPAAKSVPVRIDAEDRSGLFTRQGDTGGAAGNFAPGRAALRSVPG